MPDFDYQEMPVDVLREICARTYYTIDGLWFLAVENKFDFETAFELNQVVWQQASPIIGRRLLKNLDIEGLTPLQTLSKLIYADPLLGVHQPEMVILSDTKAVLRLTECPIQVARIRDGKGVYDGIPGCSLLFEAYAEIIDPTINVKCVACAPSSDAPEYWCEWEFEISDRDRLESTLS